jgi:hypothetical protein
MGKACSKQRVPISPLKKGDEVYAIPDVARISPHTYFLRFVTSVISRNEETASILYSCELPFSSSLFYHSAQ